MGTKWEQADLGLNCLTKRLLKHFSRRQKQTIFVMIVASNVKSFAIIHAE